MKLFFPKDDEVVETKQGECPMAAKAKAEGIKTCPFSATKATAVEDASETKSTEDSITEVEA